MKRRPATAEPQIQELLPGLADPLDVARTGLARMESYLDRCAEIIQAYGLGGEVPYPGDSVEKKVQILIFDHDAGVPEKASVSWMGRAVLGATALLTSLETDPMSSDQEIAKFLNAWSADTEAPAWAGKNTQKGCIN